MSFSRLFTQIQLNRRAEQFAYVTSFCVSQRREVFVGLRTNVRFDVLEKFSHYESVPASVWWFIPLRNSLHLYENIAVGVISVTAARRNVLAVGSASSARTDLDATLGTRTRTQTWSMTIRDAPRRQLKMST
jgi:hypothetical protein